MARMVRAGKFDKVVKIQRQTTKLNNYGSVVQSWEDLATIRASIEPLQGREYFSGPFQMGENITRVRIRYQPDLTVNRKMRVKYGDQFLDIYSVIDSKERHEELQLMCKEGEAHNG
ncbi:phage head-tail adapter protein [Pasteurellaceae bacterium Macca]|nr:phage head-tail adapter protein [Pasteurellaceae bacterium Macca]MCK3656113.1 phage head-tail adapter protein [Pasteurellaceae bacterium Macca]MCK3656856.1 phage head-tail adapter protein [Pasteurellaceae bacterium Macca]